MTSARARLSLVVALLLTAFGCEAQAPSPTWVWSEPTWTADGSQVQVSARIPWDNQQVVTVWLEGDATYTFLGEEQVTQRYLVAERLLHKARLTLMRVLP